MDAPCVSVGVALFFFNGDALVPVPDGEALRLQNGRTLPPLAWLPPSPPPRNQKIPLL